MFAPKIAKAQTKAAEGSTSSIVPHRSTLVGHRVDHNPIEDVRFFQGTIGNHAELRLLLRQTSSPAGGSSDGDHNQEVATTAMTVAEAPRRASLDFSKLPVFPPDRPAGRQAELPLTTLPVTATIQRKLAVGRVDDPLEHEADRVADQVMRTPDPDLSITNALPADQPQMCRL